jgi:MtN3 and saliva related transmembrane protein
MLVPSVGPLLLNVVGIVGAALNTLCWLPQAMKLIHERDTCAVSLPATAAFTLGIALWLVYGLSIDDWPLIGSIALIATVDDACLGNENTVRANYSDSPPPT